MPDSAKDDATLANVLGKVASGVFILTARQGEQETGMLASWVQQAGFEPPTVSVAVKHGRYVADWLQQGCPFVLNVLGEGQGRLLKHFARGFEPDAPAFEGLDVERTSGGVPYLRGVLGTLECEPSGHVDSGDHRIFLARVTAARSDTDVKPMVHIRRNGMRY